MNKKEFFLFASAMKTYYPRENLLPNDQAMELWYRQLQDIDYQLLVIVLNTWVATNKWSPKIADLRQKAAEIVLNNNSNPEDWSNAWEQVQKAIRYYGMYRVDEALEYISEFSEAAKETTRRLGFKELCLSENPTADRARFAEIYQGICEKKRKNAVLPAELRLSIEKVKGNINLIDGCKPSAGRLCDEEREKKNREENLEEHVQKKCDS